MSLDLLITLISLGVAILAAVCGIIVALVRGDMKKFIEEKMIEAEKSGKTGSEKLKFVTDAVNQKYKVMQLVLNVQKFIEHIVALSKQINAK